MNRHLSALLKHPDPEVRDHARALAPRRKPSKKQRRDRLGAATLHHEEVRKAGKDERRERVSVIREAVFARAAGRCEAWVNPYDTDGLRARCCRPASIMDHWLGGDGRRRTEESVETCWALCPDCNRQRGANFPSAEWWNASHAIHCKRHGYRFTPHYDARAASRSGVEGER